MSLTLLQKEQDINVSQLTTGQIAIITNWIPDSHIGEIVQKYKDTLLVLGKTCGNSFPRLFDKSLYASINSNLRVRVLSKGDKIKI